MTALSPIIAEIEAAMKKCTPGPWHAGCITDDDSTCNCRSICDEGYAGGIATVHVDNGITLIAEGGNDAPPFEEAKANCAYIAAANPEAVRAIIDDRAAAHHLLRKCRGVLAMMIEPSAITGSTITSAYAAAVEAEAEVRKFLEEPS